MCPELPRSDDNEVVSHFLGRPVTQVEPVDHFAVSRYSVLPVS